MNPDRDELSALHLEALRLRLQWQRALIARRLGPPAAADAGRFPRSVTMRILLRHPWLVARLLGARPRPRVLALGTMLAAAAIGLGLHTRRDG